MPMVRDLPLEDSQGLVILHWHSSEEGLHITARGQHEEIRLRCGCGRCHWIIREQFRPEGPRLVVSCHNCGRRMDFVLEGAGLPRP